jgi:hypothetical protein
MQAIVKEDIWNMLFNKFVLLLPNNNTLISPYISYSGICSASGIRTGYNSSKFYSLSDNDLISLLQTGPVAISISSDGW